MENTTLLDPLHIGTRVDELKSLKAGWLDGKGMPPAHDGLDWLAEAFSLSYPGDLPLPYLFPTPEGHVLAEWSLKPYSLSLEIDLAARRGAWHALNLDTGEEQARGVELAEPTGWSWIATAVRDFAGEGA